MAWMPVLRAFMEEAALPVTEMGPVDFRALRRFASFWRRVDMGGSGMGELWTGGPRGYPCPTLRIGERLWGIGGGGL